MRPDHGRGRLLHRCSHDHRLRRARPSLLRFQLLNKLEQLLLLWRPQQPVPLQHVLNHRQHAIPVHGMRRKRPALLHGHVQLEHEFGRRLQGSRALHLRFEHRLLQLQLAIDQDSGI